MHMRRVPIGLQASKIPCSIIPQQRRNDISSPTTQINWGTDRFLKSRSMIAYNYERRFEAYRVGSDNPKLDPNKFDFTIYDLDHLLLEHEVSEVLGKPYLSELEIPPVGIDVFGPQVFTGVFWDGTKSRPMVSLPVSFHRNPAEQPRIDEPRMWKWVHFLVCPTSPYSFISQEVSQEDNLGNLVICSRQSLSQAARAFIGNEERSELEMWIAGKRRKVYICPSASHFQGVNILGNNFLNLYNQPAEVRDLNDGRCRFEFLVGERRTRGSTCHWEDTTAGHKIRYPRLR